MIDPLMSVEEFAAWARISRTKVFFEIKTGRLAARKLGDRTLIHPDDAQKWFRSLPLRVGANAAGY